MNLVFVRLDWFGVGVFLFTSKYARAVATGEIMFFSMSLNSSTYAHAD